MSSILGLTTTENWDSYRDKNRRRSVQWTYPQGKFPLLGLLSLIDDQEETNDPYYSHFEHRWQCPQALTISTGSSRGPFYESDCATILFNGSSYVGTITAGTEYGVKVTSGDEQKFFINDVINIHVDVTNGSSGDGGKAVIRGLVTEAPTTTGATKIKFKALNTVTYVLNSATNNNVGVTVAVAGTAYSEGRSSVPINQRTEIPIEVYNYPQIHRQKIGFTRREMKTPVVFDKSGTYKHRVREMLLRHMVGIEQMLLWGTRRKEAATDTVLGTASTTTVRTYNGGLLWYLEQWEKQYSLYRGGDDSGSGPAAVTADTDDQKRIIENVTGVMTEELWDTLMERCFRYTANTSTEKLWIGGNAQLLVLTQLARSKQQLIAPYPRKNAYGYQMWEWTTPFGTLFMKTHPLFNDLPGLRNDAFIIDVKNLRYRAYKDSDTVLLRGRCDDNDADGRVDEWFSDCGLEMWQPESCMYIKNVQSFTP